MVATVRQLMEPLGPGQRTLPEAAVTVDADMAAHVLLENPELEAALAQGLWVYDASGIVGRLSAAGVMRGALALSGRLEGERDQARSALGEIEAERALLVANLGHELRTPLNAIVGYSELMRSKALGAVSPSIYGDYIDAIHVSSLHLVSLLDALLDLIKIQASEKQLNETRVSLKAVVDFSLKVVASLASQRNVTLVCKVRDDAPLVLADERMLRQILLNLLSNAIKFTEPGTSVTVSAWRTRRGEMRLEVRDHGPGIPAEKLPVVMLPFKQICDSSEPGRHGTGLGLPMVKALADLHDGQFRLVSRMKEGTRAIVVLPAARVLTPRYEESPGDFTSAAPMADGPAA